MEFHCYAVKPAGPKFLTCNFRSDNHAFFAAHAFAARLAAEHQRDFYVIRDEKWASGFASDTAAHGGSMLYKIGMLGYASCWDFDRMLWTPLPEEHDAELIPVRRKLPRQVPKSR